MHLNINNVLYKMINLLQIKSYTLIFFLLYNYVICFHILHSTQFIFNFNKSSLMLFKL